MSSFTPESQALLLGCGTGVPLVDTRSYTYVQAYAVSATSPAAVAKLKQVPARDLLFSVSVTSTKRGAQGVGTADAAPVVRVELRRSPSAFSLSTTGPATVTATFPSDSGEMVTFNITAVFVDGVSKPSLMPVFYLTPGAPVSSSLVDVATGVATVQSHVRSAVISYSCTALSASYASIATSSLPSVLVTVSAVSDGSFWDVQSRLPPAPPQSQSVTVSLGSLWDSPDILSVAVVSSAAPAVGCPVVLSPVGGEVLNISGRGLLPASAAVVTIGGVPAKLMGWQALSSTGAACLQQPVSLLVVTPPGVGTVNVTVMLPGSATLGVATVTYSPPVSIMSIVPVKPTVQDGSKDCPPVLVKPNAIFISPVGGEVLNITGLGLLPASAAVVTIGGVRVDVIGSQALGSLGAASSACRQQPASLYVVTPPGAGTVNVTVALPGSTVAFSTVTYVPPVMALYPFLGGKRTGSQFVFYITMTGLTRCAVCPNSFESCASLKAVSSVAASGSLAHCALPDGANSSLWRIPVVTINGEAESATLGVDQLVPAALDYALNSENAFPGLPSAGIVNALQYGFPPSKPNPGYLAAQCYHPPADSYMLVSTPLSSGNVSITFDGTLNMPTVTSNATLYDWLDLLAASKLTNSLRPAGDATLSPTNGGHMIVWFASWVLGNPFAVVLTSKPPTNLEKKGSTTKLNDDGVQAPPVLCLAVASTSVIGVEAFFSSTFGGVNSSAIGSFNVAPPGIWLLSSTAASYPAASLAGGTATVVSPVTNQSYVFVNVTRASYSMLSAATKAALVYAAMSKPDVHPAWWEVPVSTLLPLSANASTRGGPPCYLESLTPHIEDGDEQGVDVHVATPPWQGRFWVSIFSDGNLNLVDNAENSWLAPQGAAMVVGGAAALPAAGGAVMSVSGDLGHYSLARLWNALNEFAPLLQGSFKTLPAAVPSSKSNVKVSISAVQLAAPFVPVCDDSLGRSFVTLRYVPALNGSLARVCSALPSSSRRSGLADVGAPFLCTLPAGVPSALVDVTVLWNTTWRDSSAPPVRLALDVAARALGDCIPDLSAAVNTSGCACALCTCAPCASPETPTTTWDLMSATTISGRAKYAPAVLRAQSTLPGGALPTLGNFTLQLLGRNLGDGGVLRPPPAPLLTPILPGGLPSQPSLTLSGQPPIAALASPQWAQLVNTLQWRFSVNVSAATFNGSVFGRESMQLGLLGALAPPVPLISKPPPPGPEQVVRITSWDDSTVTLLMPPFEGIVTFTPIYDWLPTPPLSILSPPPTAGSASSAEVSADAPLFSGVRIVEDPLGSAPLADPCLAINVASPTASQCVRNARAIFDWGPYPTSVIAPCLQSNASDSAPLGAAVRKLQVTGTGFGWGWSALSLSLGGAVACDSASFKLDMSTDGTSTLTCTVVPSVVTSEYHISGSVAFQSLLPNASLVVQAACACGSYVDAAGDPCQSCPANGVCPGALYPSFAKAEYWKKNASQWLARGFSLAQIALIPPFVPCALPQRCLPHGTCANGSDPESWECSLCLSGFAPNAEGDCTQCPPRQDIALAAALIPSLVLVFIAAIGLWSLAAGRDPHQDTEAGEATCCRVYTPRAVGQGCALRAAAYARCHCTRKAAPISSKALTPARTAARLAAAAQLPTSIALIKLMVDFLQPLSYAVAIVAPPKSPTFTPPAVLSNLTAYQGFVDNMDWLQGAFNMGSTSLGCLYPQATFLDTMPFWISLPWLVAVFVIALWALLCMMLDAGFALSGKSTRKPLPGAVLPADLYTRLRSAWAYAGTLVSGSSISLAMFFFSLTLPTAINTLVSARVCSKDDNNFLLVDVRVSCYDSKYISEAGTLEALMWGYICIPVLFFAFMVTAVAFPPPKADAVAAPSTPSSPPPSFLRAACLASLYVPRLLLRLLWVWPSQKFVFVLGSANSAFSPCLSAEEMAEAEDKDKIAREKAAAEGVVALPPAQAPPSPKALWWAPVLLLRTLLVGGLSKKCVGYNCTGSQVQGMAFTVFLFVLQLLAFSLPFGVPYRSSTANRLLFISTLTHLSVFTMLVDPYAGFIITVIFISVFALSWLTVFVGRSLFPEALLKVQDLVQTVDQILALAPSRRSVSVRLFGARPPEEEGGAAGSNDGFGKASPERSERFFGFRNPLHALRDGGSAVKEYLVARSPTLPSAVADSPDSATRRLEGAVGKYLARPTVALDLATRSSSTSDAPPTVVIPESPVVVFIPAAADEPVERAEDSQEASPIAAPGAVDPAEVRAALTSSQLASLHSGDSWPEGWPLSPRASSGATNSRNQ